MSPGRHRPEAHLLRATALGRFDLEGRAQGLEQGPESALAALGMRAPEGCGGVQR